jgi:hypothetical protein
MSVGTMDVRWKGGLPEASNVVLFILAVISGMFAFSVEDSILTDAFQVLFVAAVTVLGFNAFAGPASLHRT